MLVALAVILTLPAAAKSKNPTLISDNHTQEAVVSFIKITKPSFPDRSNQSKLAQQADEARRLEALRIEEEARTIQSTTMVETTTTEPPVGSKGFIYMRESGNNPAARNAGGCLGLGQACPGSKLLAVCPDLDYACEDAFFTAYANNRYGGWGGAYEFWNTHGWW